MKFFCVILLMVAVVGSVPISEEKAKKAYGNVQTCIKEIGINQDTVDKFKEGDLSAKDDKAKCFVKCFFKRTGFMNEAGQLQRDVIINKLSSKNQGANNEKLSQLVDKCLQETGANECDLAYNVFVCYKTNKPASNLYAKQPINKQISASSSPVPLITPVITKNDAQSVKAK